MSARIIDMRKALHSELKAVSSESRLLESRLWSQRMFTCAYSCTRCRTDWLLPQHRVPTHEAAVMTQFVLCFHPSAVLFACRWARRATGITSSTRSACSATQGCPRCVWRACCCGCGLSQLGPGHFFAIRSFSTCVC